MPQHRNCFVTATTICDATNQILTSDSGDLREASRDRAAVARSVSAGDCAGIRYQAES